MKERYSKQAVSALKAAEKTAEDAAIIMWAQSTCSRGC